MGYTVLYSTENVFVTFWQREQQKQPIHPLLDRDARGENMSLARVIRMKANAQLCILQVYQQYHFGFHRIFPLYKTVAG